MKRLYIVLSAPIALLSLALVSASTSRASVPTDRETALKPDLQLAAQAHGWTLAQTAQRDHVAQVIGEIATKVAEHRPQMFVGSALAESPTGAPTLYLKGKADLYIRSLVAAAGIEIIVAEDQPFSLEELEDRERRVHGALHAAGFRYIASAVELGPAAKIPLWVTTEPGIATTHGEILAVVPADLRRSVNLTVSDEPVAKDTTSFGGMQVTVNGVTDPVYATSGFSVRYTPTGATGVTTAGHATNDANGLIHPGHAVSHSFNYQAEHRGTWGDVQWHTTNYAETAEFYRSTTGISNVLAVEPHAAISVGENVCNFGRRTLDQDCTLTVSNTSASCTVNGIWYGHMVRVNGYTSDLGDSGGPWYWGGTAYGTQKGQCGGGDTFSVADRFDEAIPGLQVLTS